MDTVTSTENNSPKDNNLKELIGEVVKYYSDKPDKTFSRPEFELHGNDFDFKIYQTDINKIVFYSSNSRFKLSEKTIDVFNKKYLCSLSGDIQVNDFVYVYFRDALNEYTVSDSICEKHYCVHRYHSNKYMQVPMIKLRVKEDFTKDGFDPSQYINFVFNIEDIRKKPLLAFFMMLNRKRTLNQPSLPLEVLKTNVLSYFNTIEKDNGEYDLNQSHDNLKCTVNYKLPMYFSRAQIKKLYELGIIKMVTNYFYDDKEAEEEEERLLAEYDEDDDDNDNWMYRHCCQHTCNFRILSDESFDTDTTSVLKKKFQTKEKMHEYIQEMIKLLF